MADTTYNIVLVEDEPDIRDRLAELLNTHEAFGTITLCHNKAEGLIALENRQPDILLTDIGLPDGSGIDLIRFVEESAITCEVMVISGFQDEQTVFDALRAGASSYILKHDDSTQITDAVLAMMAGGAPMSPKIARLMLQQFQPAAADTEQTPAAQDASLTERQVRILKLVSQGFSSREIAEKLDISYYTVTTHIKNIYRKLQVNSRTEALHEAFKMNLIS